MNIFDAVQYVGRRFQYRSDPKLLDYWSVMREINGIMRGDCDDFALTSIWKICDRNIFKFILNVLILHRYRLYFCKTVKGEKHLVGYADNLYFDNWTREPLAKNQFLYETKHKMYFFFPSPLMFWPLLLGLMIRYRN